MLRAARFVLVIGLSVLTQAQEQTTVSGTTYSVCHAHGVTQYCWGPDGEETPFAAANTASITSAPTATTSSSTTGQTTAVTSCHLHDEAIFCINGGGAEIEISLEATPTDEPPAEYTGCHAHGDEQFCVDPQGNDVLVLAEGAHAHEEDEYSHPLDESSSSEGQNCHFHAGVEHCVAAGESESGSASASGGVASAAICSVTYRDYDVPLRIGTLFAMLATSAIAVFLPMILDKLPFRSINGMIFTAIKQFGTGIIIATGFVHLYTHAYLMFTNPCIGPIQYEATTSAFVMAGIFLSFLVEFIGHRIVIARAAKSQSNHHNAQLPLTTSDASDHSCTNTDASPSAKSEHPNPAPPPPPQQTHLAALGHHHGNPFSPTSPNSKLSVLVMEVGVLFHSILIGITLVVAGDSFYKTLLVVIIFHQFFEGLALGARIALIPTTRLWPGKVVMGVAFALITPLGMAIGIGVLNQFNGNDATTLWVIGTLDALSAGVLIWVGLVDMWARDWVIEGGDMVEAGIGRVSLGGISLVAGLVLMSFLGKWA